MLNPRRPRPECLRVYHDAAAGETVRRVVCAACRASAHRLQTEDCVDVRSDPPPPTVRARPTSLGCARRNGSDGEPGGCLPRAPVAKWQPLASARTASGKLDRKIGERDAGVLPSLSFLKGVLSRIPHNGRFIPSGDVRGLLRMRFRIGVESPHHGSERCETQPRGAAALPKTARKGKSDGLFFGDCPPANKGRGQPSWKSFPYQMPFHGYYPSHARRPCRGAKSPDGYLLTLLTMAYATSDGPAT